MFAACTFLLTLELEFEALVRSVQILFDCMLAIELREALKCEGRVLEIRKMEEVRPKIRIMCRQDICQAARRSIIAGHDLLRNAGATPPAPDVIPSHLEWA